MASSQKTRLKTNKKLSLVLDLDHTLVHCVASEGAKRFLVSPIDENDWKGDNIVDGEDTSSPVNNNNSAGCSSPINSKPQKKPISILGEKYNEVREFYLGAEKERQTSTQQPNESEADLLSDKLVLSGNSTGRIHYLKLRPSLKQFLLEASELYELTIYTAGTRNYALKVIHAICRYIVDAEDVIPPMYPLSSESEINSYMAEKFKNNTKENEAVKLRRKLFGSRIVSRSDVGDLGTSVKSLERIFPDGGTMSLIVDDREDVWANARDSNVYERVGEPPTNLLFIRPYHFYGFKEMKDVNNRSGADITSDKGGRGGKELKAEEEIKAIRQDDANDVGLDRTLDILKRIHGRFYGSGDGGGGGGDGRDGVVVPKIMKKMRSEVLASMKIVFSGVVPIHIQSRIQEANGGNSSTDPAIMKRHDIIRYAEDLGAEVQTSVTHLTTHVVAARLGTEKTTVGTNMKGCKIVSVGWLMDCFWGCKLVEERRYLLCDIRAGVVGEDQLAVADGGKRKRGGEDESGEIRSKILKLRDDDEIEEEDEDLEGVEYEEEEEEDSSDDDDDDDFLANMESEMET